MVITNAPYRATHKHAPLRFGALASHRLRFILYFSEPESLSGFSPQPSTKPPHLCLDSAFR